MNTERQTNDVPLFAEFDNTSFREWLALVESELDGADFARKLVWKSPEGIDVQPIATRNETRGLGVEHTMPAFAPYLRGTDVLGNSVGGWRIRRSIARESEWKEEVTEKSIDPHRDELELVLGRELNPETVDKMHEVLRPLIDCGVPIIINGGARTPLYAALALAACDRNGTDARALRGVLAFDPCSEMISGQTLPLDSSRAFDILAAMVSSSRSSLPGFKSFVISSNVYHDAGANAVDELAATLSSAVQCLRELASRGVHPSVAARSLQFTFSIGTNLLTEIGKLRAARSLWSRMVAEFTNGDEDAMKIDVHAQTSLRTAALYDRHTNILRAVVGTIAAAVGGAGSISTQPFDQVHGERSALARRVARNTNLVLQHESYLHAVVDPAGGSYSVETLTDSIARASWEAFQELERAGGWLAAAKGGVIQEKIRASSETSTKELANRRNILVGINQYPNLGDSLGVEESEAAQAQKQSGASYERYTLVEQAIRTDRTVLLRVLADVFMDGGEISSLNETLYPADATHPFDTLLVRGRLAAPFENLRRSVEKAARRPRVYLCLYGPAFWRSARATFASGFMGLAGCDIHEGVACDDFPDALNAAESVEADIFVACSEDGLYRETVPLLVDRLRRGEKAPLILVAGNPKDDVELLTRTGVDAFIHVRSDALEVLASILKKTGLVSEYGANHEA